MTHQIIKFDQVIYMMIYIYVLFVAFSGFLFCFFLYLTNFFLRQVLKRVEGSSVECFFTETQKRFFFQKKFLADGNLIFGEKETADDIEKFYKSMKKKSRRNLSLAFSIYPI